MIVRCSCTHEFQDKVYGAFRRVHNESAPTVASRKIRCTCCGDTKDHPGKRSQGKPEGK